MYVSRKCPESVLKLILGHLCISGHIHDFVNEFVDEKCPETKLFRSLSLLSKDISLSERETAWRVCVSNVSQMCLKCVSKCPEIDFGTLVYFGTHT